MNSPTDLNKAKPYLPIRHAKTNNLKDVTVTIPLGKNIEELPYSKQQLEDIEFSTQKTIAEKLDGMEHLSGSGRQGICI